MIRKQQTPQDCARGAEGELRAIPAISLTQPWATLVAFGLKSWETRAWKTGYRGELAIHAAKTFPKWAKEFAKEEAEAGRLPPVSELPLGSVIAICQLVTCRPTVEVVDYISSSERSYGDYGDGRWAWQLCNVQRLNIPIPAKGKLGLWQWNAPFPLPPVTAD